jgi:hypothetical protein
MPTNPRATEVLSFICATTSWSSPVRADWVARFRALAATVRQRDCLHQASTAKGEMIAMWRAAVIKKT